MRAGYLCATGVADAVRQAATLAARTVIVDVEPLVASWNSGAECLDRGIAHVLGELAVVPHLQVVCFATNSLRSPTARPSAAHLRVVYLATAGKPLRTAAYRDFPRPGVVIGDQVATDGFLARRLHYAFVLCDTRGRDVPLGPRLMAACGRVLRPLLLTPACLTQTPVRR